MERRAVPALSAPVLAWKATSQAARVRLIASLQKGNERRGGKGMCVVERRAERRFVRGGGGGIERTRKREHRGHG